MLTNEASWIWTKDWNAADTQETRIVYFRKIINCPEQIDEAVFRISADSRYRLYVNGHSVSFGPCKGDDKVWYYETVNIENYLRTGANVIGAVVLRYPTTRHGNKSIWRTKSPGFYCYGTIVSGVHRQEVRSDDTWKSKCIRSIGFQAEDPVNAYLYHTERATGNRETAQWLADAYEDQSWAGTVPYTFRDIPYSGSPGNLYERPIPMMYEKQSLFRGTSAVRKGSRSAQEWETLLKRSGTVTIPADTMEIAEIDAGELMTGFLQLSFCGGSDAAVEITYSESYVNIEKIKEDHAFTFPRKSDRTDSKNGTLTGFQDVYRVDGYGDADQKEIYEPFWFRTFRFVKVKITTSHAPLTICDISYRETGYPLHAKTCVSVSEPGMDQIWDISLRTLKRCMHETYEDCPYYEQLQYAMDTRSQILFTYMVSGDDRMARRCIDDFHRSLRQDGTINCCYPSYMPNVIPTFSLYYVLIIYDHMMYFGDKDLVVRYMPTVESILNFFDRAVEKSGLLGLTGKPMYDPNGKRNPYWSFIDWTEEWDATQGVPDAILEGPLTVESLMYSYVLQRAAEMAGFIGRTGQEQEYKRKASGLTAAVNRYCRDETGIYRDGPGVYKYSQHCQIWAVLAEAVTGRRAKEVMLRAVREKHFTQCSVAMAFYLYRALEKTRLYEETKRLWDIWHQMIRENLTTCVEDHVNKRSDCHAWGALILYEFPAVVLGIRPLEPGGRKMLVRPNPGGFQWAEGEVVMPGGKFRVHWKKVAGEPAYLEVAGPRQTEIIVDDSLLNGDRIKG